MSSSDDNGDEKVSMFACLSRPRVLYSSIYAWVSITGGRFLAPFLRFHRLTDAQIGVALALQQIVMTLFSSWGETVSDMRESKHPGRGRVQVMAVGVTYGTLCYMMFGFPFEWNLPYIMIAGMYTIGLALVFPVLEAISTDFMNRSESPSEVNLGWERFFGAFSWAITNLYLSLALDVYGFQCTYQMAACSSFTVLVSLYVYAATIPQTTDSEKNGDKGDSDGQNIIKNLKCFCLDAEKVRRFHREDDHSDSDNDSGDSFHTATTASATSYPDGEINNHSVHGSEVSSMTERSCFDDCLGKLELEDDNFPKSRADSADLESNGQLKFETEHSFPSNLRVVPPLESNLVTVNEGENMSTPLNKGTTADMKVDQTPTMAVETASHSTVGNTEVQDIAITHSDALPSNLRIFRMMCSSCYGCAFLLYFLCLSAGRSVVDNLIFVYFDSVLGARYLVMGYCIVITIMVEIPVSQIAPKVIKTCGVNNLLVIGGLAYAFRVACYSWLSPRNVGYILFLEPLHGFTYAGTLNAVTEFLATVIPNKEDQALGEQLIYSMRGWCLALGVFVGGCVSHQYGPQYMYRGAARVVFLSAVSFALALILDKLLAPSSPARGGFDLNGKKVPAFVADEEIGIGSAKKRLSNGSLSSAGLFQDVDKGDFELTISVNTQLDEN